MMSGKKPHVHVKSSGFISEFTDVTGDTERGNQKSWIIQKEPGDEGFIVTPSGEDRKCPMVENRALAVNGPEYLPTAISAAMCASMTSGISVAEA
jgi:hypothetical protein